MKLPAGRSTRANTGAPSARRPQRRRTNRSTRPRSSTNGNGSEFAVPPVTTRLHWSDDEGTPSSQPHGSSIRAVERGAGSREELARLGGRGDDDERREERQLCGTAVMFVAVYNAVEALACVSYL